MKAEPLNIILTNNDNIKEILYLYNIEFKFEVLDFYDWKPSESDKEMIGECEYDKQLKQYHESKSKLFFKNVKLFWDSCDCGDGYGCSHGSWIYEVWVEKPEHIKKNLINRIQNLAKHDKTRVENWIFEIGGETYLGNNVGLEKDESICYPLPKTLGDFISDCNRIGVELEWSDWVIDIYFKKEYNKQLNIF